MAQLTFQVVEGLEAGRIYWNVSTPLTIGREEDNDVQLNDERVSRFHVKVQEDAGRLILTDLDSTNGTRVNGHPVRLRVLQPGDLIMLGRSVLLFGGPEELKRLAKRLQEAAADLSEDRDREGTPIDPDQRRTVDASELNEAFPNGPPPLPSNLTPLQTAECVDLLEYLRTEVLRVLCSPIDEVRTSEGSFARVERSAWLRLELLSPEVSRIISELTSPQ